MKTKKIIYLPLLLSVLFFTQGCEEDKIVDEVFDATTRGAILRTLEIGGNTFFNAFDTTTDYSVRFEAQDHQNGALLESVDGYISFVDRTSANGDSSTSEQLDFSIPASSFTTSSNGLPESGFNYVMSDMITSLGLSASDYTGGDQFKVRLVYNLTDGRSFSEDDASGNIASGSFFQSPYAYLIDVKCIPLGPVAGTYTIDMFDSYGDGWQSTTSGGGPGLQVNVDGTILEVGLCSPYGSAAGTFLGSAGCTSGASSGTATITIPAGAVSAVWTWPGDFWGEMSADIYGPNGDLAAEVGPSTAAGTEIILSLCP